MFFGISDYGAFVAAIVLFLAIPGPGNLALITSTSKGGMAGGLMATLGVIVGDQVLMWLAVAGVAAVLAAYPAAFAAIQLFIDKFTQANVSYSGKENLHGNEPPSSVPYHLGNIIFGLCVISK